MNKNLQPKQDPNKHNRFLDRKDPLLKSFLSDISKYPPLPKEKQIELILKAQQGDIKARQKVGTANCRLLVRIAKNFQEANVHINDLIQEGYKGLDEAISKFDPSKKVGFANFAAWWIKMRILKYTWWHKRLVRLPETQKLAINKLLKVSSKFLVEHGRAPYEDELKELTGAPDQAIKYFVDLYSYSHVNSAWDSDNFGALFRGVTGVSFTETVDRKVGGRDLRESIGTRKIDSSQIDTDIMDTSLSPEEITDKNIVTEAIEQCLDTLTVKQQEFLRDYYGLGRPAVPVKEMAKRSKTSTENIRQKRVRLIRYLKENCSKSLAPYAEI